ncbi:MAG TPA: hypothetical protein VL098_10535 [Flavipsychrobacter sp.]|nr:hypothetical protein [Flavipsychrobacter sp.]
MKRYLSLLLLSVSLCMQSCYSYRLATHAQPASDPHRKTAHVYLWGLVQKPQFIATPTCDKMGVNGVSEVYVRTNFGYALITVATLGIWCPMVIEWRCSKPCQQVGTSDL